jgi:glycosyltransferase involved in cell wall biosynthesis
MAWLYRHATLLVFPSLFEGFGISLVEAMRSGLPITCSNSTCLPEIAGDAASFFDPQSKTSIAHEVQQILGNQIGRDMLSKKGLLRATLFGSENMIYNHRKAMELAIQHYSSLRYAYDKFCSLPLSMLLSRKDIPKHHLEKASFLIRQTSMGFP